MKKLTLYMFFIFTSAVTGAGVSWVFSYYPRASYVKDKVSIEDILKYSNVAITKNNFSCEGEIASNVGSVVGSIIELNNLNKINMLSFGCYQTICTFMVTNCFPWQSQECGSRILKFNLNDKNTIQPSTFSCIDVP